MQQIWCDGEQIGILKGSQAAKAGDELEVNVDGELQHYKVEKAYVFFSESGTANARINVSYAGPPSYSAA